MFYAVNVADLTNRGNSVDMMCVKLLLAPVVDLRTPPVEVEKKRFDGMGALLNCQEERAEAIVDTIRLKLKKYQLRMYHSKTGKGGWKRV